MIVFAELSPAAATPFTEFLREPERLRSGDKHDVMRLLDAIVASADSATVAEAATVLALLKESQNIPPPAGPRASPG